jgi:hypothetical protein
MRSRFGRCYCVVAMTVALVAWAIPARADIIVGNLSSNDNNFSNVGEGLNAAMGFTMNNSSYSLTSAELVLTLQAPASDAPLLQLWSDVDNAPGAALMTFNNSTLSAGTDQSFTFTPPTAFTLQANTAYFLYLTSETATGAFFQWAGGNPGLQPTGDGAQYSSTTTGVMDNFQLAGNAIVAAPEPSSFVIVAVALLGGMGLCWIKRPRAAV